VLNGILPPVYLKHLALLVCSMHILLGDRISLESLSVAEYMLNKFYHQLEELYGKVALCDDYTQFLPMHKYLYFSTMGRLPKLHHECASCESPDTLCEALWSSLDPFVLRV